MTISFPASRLAATLAFTLAAALPAAVIAQTAAPKKPAAKASKKAAPAPKKVVEPPPPPAEADAAQIEAAALVYYGVYDCEFKQTIHITASTKYPSYVDLKVEKVAYVMKPVLSSTGAIRLEDVRGETLMVQVSAKSMLLNVISGHRIVDECISPRQRELAEAARVKAAAAAAAPAEPPAPAPVPAAAAASAATAPPAAASASSAPPK